ncbi:hypothetical protein [Cellvibrio japonicus]|uniref:Uncharacterized protein n=1 Tax=Cellvibrio japonicus (strain Ueda107) TaxID=498211 RepID=B3PCG3_CELJU|nr:hypothetical protein [Cellvibrio japonicus]ACE85160.1 hypothetical protein CJA_1280 [Cellvibrio japonicus Ueda107]QEI11867.1 hypothetical protein FY117_06240 [Cellvibrio japonicus]QEI15441.1 hypothetical protein FY116_06240 [Cellvibrio japonicus]QEI19020.1 hypothetical protein FY115_06240 [Cellvibrio japonicus]
MKGRTAGRNHVAKADAMPSGVKAVEEWYRQQSLAWQQIISLNWPRALAEYERSYTCAEFMLQQAPCKCCAVKAYVRTVVEYALVLHKTNQQPLLAQLRVMSLHSLQPMLGMAHAVQLLKPLRDIQRAATAQVDHWIGLLLMADAKSGLTH